MSKLLGTETLTISKEIRTNSIFINTALGADYSLRASRELVSTAGGAVVTKTAEPEVIRALSAVAAQTVDLGNGVTITPLQIAQALVLFIERWDLKDRAAPPPPPIV